MLQPSFDANEPSAAIRADALKAVEIIRRLTNEENGGNAKKQNDILPLDYLKRAKVQQNREPGDVAALRAPTNSMNLTPALISTRFTGVWHSRISTAQADSASFLLSRFFFSARNLETFNSLRDPGLNLCRVCRSL